MNMVDEDSFAQKLKDYDEAFDFYMDCGRLPDNLSHGDLLGGFIGQTIQDNPQLESQDPLWTELLKEELMKFVEAMLRLFQPIEEHHRKEQEFIAVFASGSIAQKQKMWGQAVKVIESRWNSSLIMILSANTCPFILPPLTISIVASGARIDPLICPDTFFIVPRYSLSCLVES